MKFLLIFTLLLCNQSIHAAPLVGFSTFEPDNHYQILNSHGVKIFSAIADTIKRVELRDGFAIVQTSTNNVTLIREDGTVLVDSVFGSEFGISKSLFSIFNKDGTGSVYTLKGKKIFPAEDESQTRPVQNILIANDRFAVMDKWMETLTVFDLNGEELFTSRQNSSVKISDGFLSAVSSLGTLSLYDEDLNLITTDSGISSIQISDEFAGYINSSGTLRFFSRQSGELPLIANVISFSLTNTFAIVKDSFGLTLYGKDKSRLENISTLKNYSASHALFAYVGNTGALWVKNENTGDSFTLNQADAYAMSDDLLTVKNGMGDYVVYSLQEETFGKVVHTVMDQTISQFQVGNGVMSFESAITSNSAKVYSVLNVGTTNVKSVLIDELRVNKVNLSVNHEEWNWQ